MRYTYQVFPESEDNATCLPVELSPVPMRTMFVGLLPAKSMSAAVAHVGFEYSLAGAFVKLVCTKPKIKIR